MDNVQNCVSYIPPTPLMHNPGKQLGPRRQMWLHSRLYRPKQNFFIQWTQADYHIYSLVNILLNTCAGARTFGYSFTHQASKQRVQVAACLSNKRYDSTHTAYVCTFCVPMTRSSEEWASLSYKAMQICKTLPQGKCGPSGNIPWWSLWSLHSQSTWPWMVADMICSRFWNDLLSGHKDN
jgi:hypothetical protein